MRKTKIICTIGPSTESEEQIKELIANGMDAARLNFSHSSHAEHIKRITTIRNAARDMGKPIPIILDTKGPEIRIGTFKSSMVKLSKGDSFTLYSEPMHSGDAKGIGISYPMLSDNISIGARILIDDGKAEFKVKAISNGNIECEVENNCVLTDRKSLNIPGVLINQEFLSKADCDDILLGIKMEVDFIAASFVRSATDIKDLRRFLRNNNGEGIRIISKIENHASLKNIDSIIEESDAIMIARGDMGVELPYQSLPAIQKNIIKKCIEKGKTVITATQMLDSMQYNIRPTRAEVCDVANAIYDGTSAVMLSGETAAGKYPIEAIKAMSLIAETTEIGIAYDQEYFTPFSRTKYDSNMAIAAACAKTSNLLKAKSIIVSTMSGRSARLTSYFRPKAPIIAFCTDVRNTRQLSLEFGVKPIFSEYEQDKSKLKKKLINRAKELNLISKDDTVIVEIGNMDLENDRSFEMIAEVVN